MHWAGGKIAFHGLILEGLEAAWLVGSVCNRVGNSGIGVSPQLFLNAICQQFLCSRLVIGANFAGILGIDVLEPKLLAIGDAVRGDKLLGSFDDFFGFHLLAGG